LFPFLHLYFWFPIPLAVLLFIVLVYPFVMFLNNRLVFANDNHYHLKEMAVEMILSIDV
tara:strand:+ start:9368 stop:9544 length:177 start_codon:yes stop_codon:yes gene_type:complete